MARINATNDELTDMTLIYGECRRNSVRAANLYRERYPEREPQGEHRFRRLEERLRQHGQLQPPRNHGNWFLINSIEMRQKFF